MIDTIVTALKKKKQTVFLVLCDFQGYKYGLSSIGRGVDDYNFEGRIINDLSISSSLSISSMRFSDSSVAVDIANTNRFHDLEKTRYLDAGTVNIYLWTDGLSWSDISAYPVFFGDFRKNKHNKFVYSFDVVDASNARGKTITSITDLEGNAGANIQTVLETYTSLGVSGIDYKSLGTMKQLYNLWEFTTSVDSRTNAIDLIDRMLLQCMCGRVQRYGKLSIVVFDLDGPTSWQLNESDILGDSVVVKSTPHENVVNDLYVEYNQSSGSWGSNMTYDKDSSDICRQSYFDYGARPQQRLVLSDIATQATARKAADQYLAWRAFRHDIIECFVPHHIGLPMVEGDIAEVTLSEGPSNDGAGWNNERFILLDRKIDMSRIAQRWWRISHN